MGLPPFVFETETEELVENGINVGVLDDRVVLVLLLYLLSYGSCCCLSVIVPVLILWMRPSGFTRESVVLLAIHDKDDILKYYTEKFSLSLFVFFPVLLQGL